MKNIFILKTLILLLVILTLVGCKISDPNQIALKLTNRFTNQFDSYDMMLRTISNYKLCLYSQDVILGQKDYVAEARRRGLDCGFANSNKTIENSKSALEINKKNQSKTTSVELYASKREADELRRKLEVLKTKELQYKQRINIDNEEPIISAFIKHNGSNVIIYGRVIDNIEVAEMLIDGEQIPLSNLGKFETSFYIPRMGKTIQIVAYDVKGNRASKTIKLERGNIQQASGPVFDTLNPSGKTVKSNPNALALIIGVADYKKTNANALYADKDAEQFYDYARMKLGIPSSNIKE